MVRSFLNGRFENTAFCLLAPDGEERLSRTGRSPDMAFGRRGPRPPSGELDEATIDAMEKVARRFKPAGDPDTPVVQDFHSFRQALNVAAGDQRLLVYVTGNDEQLASARKKLSPVMGDAGVIGKFHTDFFSADADAEWAGSVTGAAGSEAIHIIHADTFGQQGKTLKQLPLDTAPADIKAALLAANDQFSKTETRKVYRDHVREGRRKGVFFERDIEYGEDRDGDGVIDHRGGLDRPPGDRREDPPPRGNRRP